MTSALYIALASLMLMLLSTHVIKGRSLFRVTLGDDNNQDMLRRIRAQANFTEYTPLFLILLVCAEKMGLYAFMIHLFGIAFLLGRISHAYGLLKAERKIDGKALGFKYRINGMKTTFTCYISLSLYILFKYVI